MKRLVSSVFLFALVLFAPWWAWFFVGLIFALIFKNFIEFPIFALVSDLAFATNFQSFFDIPFLLSITTVLIYLAIQLIKPNMRIGAMN